MHIGILAAAAHAAANNSLFNIYYNPRTSPAEFVIPLAKYNKALIMYGQVSLGMRFRMMFETQESGGVRRYMGTITGISDLDPARWKNSQWRSLQVGWDESASAGEERPRRVSIWDIEPVVTPFYMCPSPFFRQRDEIENVVAAAYNKIRGIEDMSLVQWMKNQPTSTCINLSSSFEDPSKLLSFQSPPTLSHSNKPKQPPYYIHPTNVNQQFHVFSQQKHQISRNMTSPQIQHNLSHPLSEVQQTLQQQQLSGNSQLTLVQSNQHHPPVDGDIPTSPSTNNCQLTSSNFRINNHQGLGDDDHSSRFLRVPEQPRNTTTSVTSYCLDENFNIPNLPDALFMSRGFDSQNMMSNYNINCGAAVETEFSAAEISPHSFDMSSFKPNDAGVLGNGLWGNQNQQQQRMRTYTKVQKRGSVGRTIDVTRYKGYEELRQDLARMFGIEGELEDTQWKLVYVDHENDILLVGDDPWEEFVSCVQSIKILSYSEVQKMSLDGDLSNVRVPNKASSTGTDI